MAAYKLHEKFIDPAASQLSSYFCKLFILIGRDYFQYVILDSDRNKFVALADFRTPSELKKSERHEELIAELVKTDDFLKKNYPSVVVGIDNPFHLAVPAAFFDQGQVEKYLNLHFTIPAGYQTSADKVEELDAVNISSIPGEIKKTISTRYDKTVFVHRSTGIMKAASHHHNINPSSIRLFIIEKGKTIDLALFEGSKPLVFNSFSFRGREDVLYYTLYVLEQSGIKPENTELCLGGAMDEGTDSYRLLKQYFGNISFAPRPGNFSYSAIFDHLPPQRYIDLFALALCGS